MTKVVTRFGGISRHFDTIDAPAGVRVVFEHGGDSKTEDMVLLKSRGRTLEAYIIDRDHIIKPVTDEQLSKIRENEKNASDGGNR